MAGLRARQKADRHQRILKAAGMLFRNSGYDNARIEDIAELAEVSVGTFYNYFQNKGDILLAIVSMEVEEVLQAGAGTVLAPPLSVAAALDTLIAHYFDHSLVYLSKEMWRMAMAIATQRPQTPFGKHYKELDRRLCEQVMALLRALQDKGVVAPGIDSTSMGELIFNNLNMMFIEFAKSETMTIDQLKAAVTRQMRPLAGLAEVSPPDSQAAALTP